MSRRPRSALPGLAAAAVLVLAACGGGGGGGNDPVAVPLWLADGQRGTAGNLYRYDPATGTVTTIGAIGFAVTGLALSPTGAMYGVTSALDAATTPDGMGNLRANLITIDTNTGTGAMVGPLQDAAGAGYVIADVTFSGGRLLGLPAPSGNPQGLVEIALATGLVTVIGGPFCIDPNCPTGMGLAAHPNGTTFLAPDGGTGRFLMVANLTTGVPSFWVTMSGGNAMEVLNALAFGGGILYGVEADRMGNTRLVRIDFQTGAMTPLVGLPSGVDAVEAPFK